MEKLEILIGQGKTDEAFEYLRGLLQPIKGQISEDLQMMLTLLQPEWRRVEKENRYGLLTLETYGAGTNKVHYKLLNIGRDAMQLVHPGEILDDTKTVKILFLAANPKNKGNLRLNTEANKIDMRLRLSYHRDRFVFVARHALKIIDIQRIIAEERPDFLHFSGHGIEEGVYVEDENGMAVLIGNAALVSVLGNLHRMHPIQAVVLNSCLSMAQAQAMKGTIPHVVGMTHEVQDAGAVAFAEGFYTAIFAGAKVAEAKEMGCNEMKLQGLDGWELPVLL
jgi:hypothetical protein